MPLVSHASTSSRMIPLEASAKIPDQSPVVGPARLRDVGRLESEAGADEGVWEVGVDDGREGTVVALFERDEHAESAMSSRTPVTARSPRICEAFMPELWRNSVPKGRPP